MEKKQGVIEKVFEDILWSTRFTVLLAVIFGLISAIALFVVGSMEAFEAVKSGFSFGDHHGDHDALIAGVIGAVDLYLIGIVLLIFSFGVYELFISKIDVARQNKEVKVLEITSLDSLKSKIIKVIVMVLVVSFFQRVLLMPYDTPLNMLYFAISIFAISFGIYFLHKEGGSHKD